MRRAHELKTGVLGEVEGDEDGEGREDGCPGGTAAWRMPTYTVERGVAGTYGV